MSSSSSGGGAYEPIDDVSPGSKYVGFFRLGDNSSTGNVWEYCVGADIQNNCSTGNVAWDANISDGIDSGWIDVSLKVSLNGSGSIGTLKLGQLSIDYSQGTYSNIARVQLQASAKGVTGQMLTRSISVDFTRADGSEETVVIAPNSAPIGDNTGTGTASQALQINPTSNNFVSAFIRAQIRLNTPMTSLPAADALTFGIYVFTA